MVDVKLPVHCLATSAPVGPSDGRYRWLVLLTATSVALWAVPLVAGRDAVKVSVLPCSLAYTPPASQPQVQVQDKEKENEKEEEKEKEKGKEKEKEKERETGPVVSPQLAFPRIASFSPDGSALAIAGDDKALRIWRLPTSTAFAQLVEAAPTFFAYGREHLRIPLPKRGAVFVWEPITAKGALHLLVGDRHGDIRSFAVPQDSSKPPSNPSQSQQKDQEAAEMGFFDPSDPLSPRVGHVGMLTDAVFAPLPVPSSYAGPIPPLLISADRDEHIRVSRWGPRRSGWIAEHYVLGSSSFVGALLVVPYAPSFAAAAGAAGRSSALLSADGGLTLRLSNYLPHYPASSPAPAAARTFLSTNELDPSTVSPYVRTDVLPAAARRLLRLPPLKNTSTLPPVSERDSLQGTPHLAIVQLALLSAPAAAAPSHVLVRLEASTALHVLSLESVYRGTNDFVTTDLGRPIVHATVEPEGKTVYVSLDTRAQASGPNSAAQEEDHKEAEDIIALQLHEGALLVPQDSSLAGLRPLQASRDAARPTVQALGKQGLASLDLYPALSSFPKTASDGSAAETDSPEARIRASMASGRRAAGREKNLRALFGDQEAGA